MNNDLKISAVICTYNRDKFIRTALEKLTHQSLDKHQYEILVIDNNCTDRTPEICHSFIKDHPDFNIHYFVERNKGLSFARNRGWNEAQSSIITYIDDDAEADPKFLESIVYFLQQHPDVVGVGGRVIPIYPDTGEPEWMNRYLNGFVGRVDFGDTPKPFAGRMKYPAGCNMTYRKKIIQQAGGFNNQLTFRSDDKYIFYQVSKLSEKIYYLPPALVYHNIDGTRLEFNNFKKLFLKTGNEEKIRIKTEGGNLLKKGIELLIKFFASLIIYGTFLLKRKEIKGRYIVWAQWFTLKGFFQKSVFVR
jgi:glucosyl-dolichyl phosphate glucuronosyltransferase